MASNSNYDDHEYFTMTPNIIFDMGLSAYAQCLYLQLNRAQGQDKEKCWPSVEYLAKQCCVSEHTIIKAKQELIERGLITVENHRSSKGGFPYHVYHVADIWDENESYYSGNRVLVGKLVPGKKQGS
jgi:predicted transcriptional regulator